MADTAEEEQLAKCFQDFNGAPPTSITQLRPHASERRIYRLSKGPDSIIGIINKSTAENEAFIYFAHLFKGLGLPVPEIYLYRPELYLYLEQDLGDRTLLDHLQDDRAATGLLFPGSSEQLYKQVLEYLPRFQIEAAPLIDFNKCFPTQDFSAHVLRSDMTAFSHELVRRLCPEYDLAALEQDFEVLTTFLLRAEGSFFLYRDFQARNIMLHEGMPYFIDFQGGRRGPLQYDVVSLLYQSSAQIPPDSRLRLAQFYLETAGKFKTIDSEEFYRFYNCFILGRILQVLGVYGRQGLGGGKEYFRSNITRAVQNLLSELTSPHLPLSLPRLRDCAETLNHTLKIDGTHDR